MYIIVGLGNIGKEYENTRHNAGFAVLDLIAQKLGVSGGKSGFHSVYIETRYAGERVVLAKPTTFMNNSGFAVRDLMNWYKCEHDELIVIYDDIELPPGDIRIREKGSAGTHNGMRNIVKELNTEQFARVRIGTKTDELANHEVELIDFVLSKVDFANKQVLQQSIDTAVEAFEMIIEGDDIQRIQERVNRKK